MQDGQIVELFLRRDEESLSETRQKYGGYLKKIAYNILGDFGESEECLNDALLRAWNSIPPQKPDDLRTYLVMLTRRCAVDALRKRTRQKRRPAEYSVSLEELDISLSDGNTPEREVELGLLTSAINDWLNTLPPIQRQAFVGRYYFCDPVNQIAKYLGISVTNAKTLLRRARLSLKAYLEKECII